MESSQGIYQDSAGISFADIALRHQDGRQLASVRVRTAGHTHTGVASFRRCRGRTRACLRGWVVGLPGVAVVAGPWTWG